MCPAGFFAPETAESSSDGVVRGLCQAAVSTFAETIVALSDLPHCFAIDELVTFHILRSIYKETVMQKRIALHVLAIFYIMLCHGWDDE